MRPERICLDIEAHGFHQSAIGQVTDEELLSVSSHLGRVVSDERDPRLFREISPRSTQDARANTLSSRYGFGAFPFHTDCAYWPEPAALLVLYCCNPGNANRKTLLSDSGRWSLSATQERILTQSMWRSSNGRHAFLCTLATDRGRRRSIRFDQDCMSPVTKESIQAADIVTTMTSSGIHEIVWSVGDLLIIDNRRMLHARTATDSPDPDRLLKRLLVASKGN